MPYIVCCSRIASTFKIVSRGGLKIYRAMDSDEDKNDETVTFEMNFLLVNLT